MEETTKTSIDDNSEKLNELLKKYQSHEAYASSKVKRYEDLIKRRSFQKLKPEVVTKRIKRYTTAIQERDEANNMIVQIQYRLSQLVE